MGGHEHLNFVASYMLMSMYLNFSAYVFVANYVLYALYETMCELLGETYWYYLSIGSVYGFHNDQDYLWYSIYMVKAMYQMVWYDFQTLSQPLPLLVICPIY